MCPISCARRRRAVDKAAMACCQLSVPHIARRVVGSSRLSVPHIAATAANGAPVLGSAERRGAAGRSIGIQHPEATD